MRPDTITKSVVGTVPDEAKRLFRRSVPPAVFDRVADRLDPDRRVLTDIETPAGTITLRLPAGDNLRKTAENPREKPLPRVPGVGFEPTFVRDLSRRLDGETTYYDIGAAKGYFAEVAKLAGVPESRLHLFEPSSAADRLESKYPESTVTTELVGSDSGENCLTLTEYALEKPDPDVVKVDAEGAEFDILRGLTPLSPIVYVEVHPLLLSASDSVPALVDFLTERGYDVAWADHRRVDGDWHDAASVPLPYLSTLSTNSEGPYMLRGLPPET